jgi:D-alanine-D-alanine ligase
MKFSIMIFYGGPSYEHDVSIISAKNIIDFLKTIKEVIVYPIYIDRDGRWYLTDANLEKIKKLYPVSYNLTEKFFLINKKKIVPDVCFSIIHGNLGEDGKLQGFFETLSIPYTGCDVLSSSIAMNKKLTKTIASLIKIPILKDVTFSKNDFKEKKDDILSLIEKLGMPVFVKPNTLGSSVGVSKVKDFKDITKAIEKAFRYDNVVMVEVGLDRPREVVCGVLLKRNKIIVSKCGEVVVGKKHEFYDYNAKYIDPNGMQLKIPADLDEKIEKKIQEYSISLFKTIGGSGFSRVDFFVDKNNNIYLCEINTIPGFTSHSLFPSLFKYSGVDLKEQLKIIIESAFIRGKDINIGKIKEIERIFK